MRIILCDTIPAVPARRPSPETVLFWALLALHLLPVWLFSYTPTQDGPGHQALTAILRQYALPEAGLLRQYYLPNREALPNWLIFFLMGRVLGFVAVPVAEKIVLTAYVLLLPLSARYALRAIDPKAGFLAVLAFPFVYNYLFNMGFFNFCWSLAAFFFTTGYWLRNAGRMGPARTAVLALLVLWVYFCHPVTLAVAVAVLLTLAGWRMLLDLRAAPGRPAAVELWGSFRHWLLAPALACLPPLALMAAFVGRRTGARITMLPMAVKLRQLAGLYSLSSLTRWTVPLAILLACLFYWLAALCLRKRRGLTLQTGDGFLLATAVLTVVHFAAPSELAGGGFINQRLVLFPFLTLLLWLGTFEHPARRRLRVQIAAAGIALAFLGLMLWKYAEIDRLLSEIVATADAVAPDHTLLFLSFSHRGDVGGGDLAYRTAPFLHAGGYVAARRRLVDLSLYEANEDYFPLLFRPSLNPYRYLSNGPLGIEQDPPEADILSYPRRTGGRVDYVLLWGLRNERRGEPKVRAILDQLAAGFDLVERSPSGRVLLYRAR
ncbi:MAG TPA: hypothetical protein VFR03_16170 [Thermoanaerobaculia bacterium]|nr:hypothetical protein [Thermoanaerobaculia bacterium]